jgi:hypothetical protein
VVAEASKRRYERTRGLTERSDAYLEVLIGGIWIWILRLPAILHP